MDELVIRDARSQDAPGQEMKRFLADIRGRVHARAEDRRRRALQRAAREMKQPFDESHGGSIWRSGKGGSHPG